MLKMISDRLRVSAQWSVVRVRSVQLLRCQHGLTTSVARLTLPEPGQQGLTPGHVPTAVPTLVPAASRLLSCAGAVRTPRVGGEPAAGLARGAEAGPQWHGHPYRMPTPWGPGHPGGGTGGLALPP
jgi:hypothetical protein